MTLGEGLRDKAAVVGIGETEYSKESGRTELALACEAISKAADDAGIPVSEIDGLVRYDMDSVDEVALTSHLGLKNLGWMSHTGYGGTGGNAVIVHAAAAIAAGLASTVVCYRALNERSGHRYGQASTWMQEAMSGFEAFQMPWGMLTPAHMFGQFARRHMVEYGTTSEQFGHVAVALRKHGSMNPRAMMRKPITLGGPPGLADDRRPPPSAGLLHRERRRLRRDRHRGGAGAATPSTRRSGSWGRHRAAAPTRSGSCSETTSPLPSR